jgi:sulfoxide reductase heme-binding subunit YedZ
VLVQIAVDTVGDLEHDSGIRELGTLAGRLAYAMMCASLTWGVLTSMGWVNRLTGRQALRSSHMIFATLTLAFAGIHLVSLLYLRVLPFSAVQVLVPFNSGGKLPHTMGILAFEGMLIASVVVGLRRWMTYYRFLWLHRLAYPAFALGVGHAFFGAVDSGQLAALWLGGLTLLIPAVTTALLRLVPAKALATTGLIEDAP